jgi:SAM-dependent methyltransferase
VGLTFADLGSAPLSNAYLSKEQLLSPETWYPLRVLVCENCWLVQTEDCVTAGDLFTGSYAYFSSTSSTWLDHARRYVVTMKERLCLGSHSLVAEIAANDGYLLQYVRGQGIPCYGIEPTASTAGVARGRGIDIVEEFFSEALAMKLAAQGRQADLIVANNVLAHVPDINGFTTGIGILLKPQGTATFEFPYLLNLIRDNQFDTIYHEHYSYLSFTAVERIFSSSGLRVVDVEECPTHGGSLRVFAQRKDFGVMRTAPVVAALLRQEHDAGVTHSTFYKGFQARINAVKYDLLSFLLAQKQTGKKVGGYGAAAKGNTLLNFAGIRADLLPYVVDRSPAKQGKFLPGSRIPVVDVGRIYAEKPDWILILPWNLRGEIEQEMAAVTDWGGKFVRAVPKMEMS